MVMDLVDEVPCGQTFKTQDCVPRVGGKKTKLALRELASLITDDAFVAQLLHLQEPQPLLISNRLERQTCRVPEVWF